MGKPDNPERFVPVEVGEWGRRYGTVHVDHEIWAALRPNTRELTFYLENGERMRLDFALPVGRIRI